MLISKKYFKKLYIILIYLQIKKYFKKNHNQNTLQIEL